MAMCGELMGGFGGCWSIWPEPKQKPNGTSRPKEEEPRKNLLREAAAAKKSLASNQG